MESWKEGKGKRGRGVNEERARGEESVNGKGWMKRGQEGEGKRESGVEEERGRKEKDV